MRNDRLLEIVGYITQHPEEWIQDVYHCGTAHCVAGHAELRWYKLVGRCFTNLDGFVSDAVGNAHMYLEVCDCEDYPFLDWMFAPRRTLAELQIGAILGRQPTVAELVDHELALCRLHIDSNPTFTHALFIRSNKSLNNLENCTNRTCRECFPD